MRLITGLLLLLLSMGSYGLPMLKLQPSSAVLAPSETFSVDVLLDVVEPSDPLLAFGFDVTAQLGLSFGGAAVGGLFLDDSPFFADTDVAGSTFPVVSGSNLLLATLDLIAGASAGTFDISIMSDIAGLGLSEGIFLLSSTLMINETVSVEVRDNSSAVSVPSIIALYLLAFGILVLRRLIG